METKLYDKNRITLDGRLDEAVWDTAQEHTGFKTLKRSGGNLAKDQSFFRILPCEDRIYLGIRNAEPYMEQVLANHHKHSKWVTDSVELFFSPSGNAFDFYQFLITLGGESSCKFYSEGGNISPDPYAPDWKYAVYTGEDFWSVEIEIPLTAFYMTPAANWRTDWLFNICRTRINYGINDGVPQFYTWGDLIGGYLEPASFPTLGGFPIRPAENDIRICSASAVITEKTEKGFVGMMTVKTVNPEVAEFVFSSRCTDAVTVNLNVGNNEFTLPCCFAEEGRQQVELQLTRKSDGVAFKRGYPVRVSYEPIKLTLTLPEFRGNFYPGQDYSKVVGNVTANKAVTVTLEGPGIGTRTVTPDAEGNFTIETPDFEFGVAMLTISDSDNILTKKIRRLAPTGHRMAWISGGNLVVDGKPVLRRNFYAPYYNGGEVFKLKYDTDDLHITKEITSSQGFITPGRLMSGSDCTGGEATKDNMPSEEMFRLVDGVIERNKDRDFVYYYLDDEPECRDVSSVYLKHMYDYITDKDPYHVVMMASREAGEYIHCADWVETHPYISVEVRNGKRFCGTPINTLASYIEQVTSLNRSDKCIGLIPTCFSYKSFSIYAEYPNFDEYICHIWAAMIAGGKTLWAYAYHDLNDRASIYEGSRYVFSGFEALEDMVLFAKRTELIRTREVHSVLYELNGEKMFVLVNLVPEPQQVTLDGISGTWYNFRHGGTVNGNSFTLKPYEVLIGTSKVRDAGLPTYQETAALIDKLEYERTHGGSLLFDRYKDITVTASAPLAYKYKLFDGNRSNFAAALKFQGKFLEMDLTKVKPTFSKVVISGFQLDDMTIKVRNNDELSTPAVKEVKTEQYSTSFVLEEPICPDCLRFEFGENNVELYEIEVF